MSIFLDIIDQHARTDQLFVQAINVALAAVDEAAFDEAFENRNHNDQAYFLYLFTRLEAVINASFEILVSNRAVGAWDVSRPWDHFSEQKTQDIALLVKAAMLTPKGHQDWTKIQEYYRERNLIGHGKQWAPTTRDSECRPGYARHCQSIQNYIIRSCEVVCFYGT